MTNIVTVALAGQQYPIYIGSGLLAQTELFQRLAPYQQVFIVSDETVAPLYMSTLQNSLRGRDTFCYVIPAGEEQKSLANFERIIDSMVLHKVRRNALLIALGGGVVGDLGGFVAACYQRGIDVLQIPTTLLAQVDSSVGGKTAVNHSSSKNMIGAFHQPIAVLADMACLRTLPERELISGFGEILKYGLLDDQGLFAWLEQHVGDLLQANPDALGQAIARSCEIKANIVARDPKEQGIRAWLNLGHTFAHAIETELGYGVWRHGEAVALGLLMAVNLSQQLGLLEQADLAGRLRNLLTCFNLPVALPVHLNPRDLLTHMALDKKNVTAGLRFIVPLRIGHVTIVDNVAIEPVLLAMT